MTTAGRNRLEVPVIGDLPPPDARSVDGGSLGKDLRAKFLDKLCFGGATLQELAALVDGVVPDALNTLRETYRRTDNLIRLVCPDVSSQYDIIVVEQGYGGVYVHTSELVASLRSRWRVLLICPEDPLFDGERHKDNLTLSSVRAQCPQLTFFGFMHLTRALVRHIEARLLLVTHRSWSIPLFDLIEARPSVIYCDGYFDSGFHLSEVCQGAGGSGARELLLQEIFYLMSMAGPDFLGIPSSPSINVKLLHAGYIALRSAKENWCWGSTQRENLASAFPQMAEQVKFMPPFTHPSIFGMDTVARSREILFTTTMHNIEKKGFPELQKAMLALPEIRVVCVVRQPDKLPPLDDAIRSRLLLRHANKREMIRLYHTVAVNCRVSREESSPISVLESMLCEVPQVVSTVVASQLPILEDGATGFVVNPDDADGLVKALDTLDKDVRLRELMGAECRRRASRYAYDRRVHEFERLLS